MYTIVSRIVDSVSSVIESAFAGDVGSIIDLICIFAFEIVLLVFAIRSNILLNRYIKLKHIEDKKNEKK